MIFPMLYIIYKLSIYQQGISFKQRAFATLRFAMEISHARQLASLAIEQCQFATLRFATEISHARQLASLAIEQCQFATLRFAH